MHFKRYNLVIISSEWIGAASHYTQLKSEITRRILTTSTEQSVLTFFSTSNSIFIVSYYKTDYYLYCHFSPRTWLSPCIWYVSAQFGTAAWQNIGSEVSQRCRLSIYYSRKNHYIAFPLLVKYGILFQSLLLFLNCTDLFNVYII